MNPKLKKVVAVIALVCMLIFSVSLVLFFIDKDMLNGAIMNLTIWSGAVGGLLYFAIFISRGFPHQNAEPARPEKPADDKAEQPDVKPEAEPTEAKTEAETEPTETETNVASDSE